jgi:hypothetical protein
MSNLKAKTAQQLATKLAKGGIVNFTFVKKNLDLRSASATTDNKFIPKEKRAKISNELASTAVRFFDTSINEWRSVSLDAPIYF